MDSQSIVIEFVIPAVDWMQVLSFLETGLAFGFLFMAGSVSSYLFVWKISDEAIDSLGGLLVLPFLWGLFYWIVRSLVTSYLNQNVVDQDRLDELESKAAFLEDFFGVDDNE